MAMLARSLLYRFKWLYSYLIRYHNIWLCCSYDKKILSIPMLGINHCSKLQRNKQPKPPVMHTFTGYILFRLLCSLSITSST